MMKMFYSVAKFVKSNMKKGILFTISPNGDQITKALFLQVTGSPLTVKLIGPSLSMMSLL